MNQNISNIKNSLKVLEIVFKELEDYRVIGSLLVAALNKKPHRQLHDIDLLIDIRIYPEVETRFKKLGFKKITKHALVFEWDEFHKENHLTFGVLLKGYFNKNYFEWALSKYILLSIDIDYLKLTDYRLYDYKIRGIPLRSIYEGIKSASFNTKRLTDKQVVVGKMNGSLPDGISLNQAFKINVLGINVPYLYGLFSQIYNIIGGIRLKLGKSYDILN